MFYCFKGFIQVSMLNYLVWPWSAVGKKGRGDDLFMTLWSCGSVEGGRNNVKWLGFVNNQICWLILDLLSFLLPHNRMEKINCCYSAWHHQIVIFNFEELCWFSIFTVSTLFNLPHWLQQSVVSQNDCWKRPSHICLIFDYMWERHNVAMVATLPSSSGKDNDISL